MPQSTEASSVKAGITQDGKRVGLQFSYKDGGKSFASLAPTALPSLIRQLFAAMVDPDIAREMTALPKQPDAPVPLLVLPSEGCGADTLPAKQKLAVWFHLPGGVSLSFVVSPAGAEVLAGQISSFVQQAHRTKPAPSGKTRH